jgi:large subunit ribosomal protein L16
MLSPKRVNFRKQQRGRMRGIATRGNTIAFGEFALQAQECGWITFRQIEASRRAMTRHIKRAARSGSASSRTSPSPCARPKPGWAPVRATREFWVAVIKPGRILFEMGGAELTPEVAREAMRLAQYKLPLKTKFLTLADQASPEPAVTVES